MVKRWGNFLACVIGFENRILVLSIMCMRKNDLHCPILINAQTMPKSKSRPRLSDNPGIRGGRPRSARKRKVTPAAELSPSVQTGVASQPLSLTQDPTSGPSDV